MSERCLVCLRALGWLVAITAVLIFARVLVYSLVPHPTPIGERLEGETGGPVLVIGLVACALAVGVSVAIVATAAVAVAERRRLEPLATSTSSGIRPVRVARQAFVLFAASSIAFALLESYLHWRAGLGWHGLRCLTGPVHRDALPFLASLSLLASAAIAAGGHVLAWLRRVIGRLVARVPRVVARVRRYRWSARESILAPHREVASLGARAPPRSLLVRVGGIERRHFSSNKESAGMHVSKKSRVAVIAVAATAALVIVSSAFAHAEISPAVVKAKTGQVFTLAVPTEEENATTTTIELTPPAGFAIDSFAPSPGWKRDVQQTGKGEETVIQRVTWSGGSVPTEEDALFQFLASPDSSKTYTFDVRQTYSNGKVVDWSGAESSDTPAPTIEAKDSIGGGGTLLTIVALVPGGLGILIGLAALLAGRRSLA
jgi:uncharacterized protein YcnI